MFLGKTNVANLYSLLFLSSCRSVLKSASVAKTDLIRSFLSSRDMIPESELGYYNTAQN